MKKTSSRFPQGSALMMVLLVVGVLSSLVLSALLVVNRNAERVFSKAAEMEVTALAQKGIALGVHPAILRNDSRLREESSDRRQGYEVEISSEGTRLNVNAVLARGDKVLLRSLFYEWGIGDSEAAEITDALFDWVDRNEDAELNGAERDVYEELGYTDRPYNRPFTSIDEMQLVYGFDQIVETKEDWRDSFTVYGDGELDIHEVGEELLAVATQLDPAVVEPYLYNITGADEMLGTEDDVSYETLDDALDAIGVSEVPEVRDEIRRRFRLRSNVRRVESNAFFNDTTKSITLVLRQSGGTPRILYQKETLTHKIKE